MYSFIDEERYKITQMISNQFEILVYNGCPKKKFFFQKKVDFIMAALRTFCFFVMSQFESLEATPKLKLRQQIFSS